MGDTNGVEVAVKVTRTLVAAALGVVLATGCSAHPGVAASVDGRTISQAYLDATYGDIGHANLDKSTTLVLLIAAPYFIEAAAEHGVGVSEAEGLAAAEEGLAGRGIVAISDGTVEFFRLQMALQNLQNVPGGAETIGEVETHVLALDMDINPRYGELDPTTGMISPASLPWIVGG